MHLGNAFTALLAWLSARSQGGRIVLRIEDLDPARCRPAYARQLREDLTWLGLDWDQEMPPQSARSAVYAEYFDQLDRRGLLYPCYCSRGQLHAASAPHASDGRVIYAGACRDLTPAQRAEIHKAPAWRIRVPDETISFSDRVFGPTAQNLQKECGDFILRRADGVYAYQLAVVCDDALAGVTEVVRGAICCRDAAAALFNAPARLSRAPLCPRAAADRRNRPPPLQAGMATWILPRCASVGARRS